MTFGSDSVDISVIGTKGCVMCNATMQAFAKEQSKGAAVTVEYVEVDKDDDAVRTALQSVGVSMFPYVIDNRTKETWTGFRRERVKAAAHA